MKTTNNISYKIISLSFLLPFYLISNYEINTQKNTDEEYFSYNCEKEKKEVLDDCKNEGEKKIYDN